MKSLLLLFFLCSLGVAEDKAKNTTAEESAPIEAIANLTDPKKLATLKGERASNPRFQKCLYWLAVGGRMMNKDDYWEGMSEVIVEASRLNKTFGTPYASAIRDALFASYMRAENYGLFTSAGLEELKQGKSATINEGEYAGQEATADHYIPRSVCPELDNQIYNLRLCPSSVNSSKGNKVGKEQVESAESLNQRGLLSDKGLEAMRKAYERDSH